MTVVRLSRIYYPVTVLGPGQRLGIWFQGCTLRCPGCMSHDTWDPQAGINYEIKEIIDKIEIYTDEKIAGVTISGGEPFQQPDALMELIDGLRKSEFLSRKEIDIICYSGFNEQFLRENYANIIERLDVLIPEPYNPRMISNESWRGSNNQPFILLTPLGAKRFNVNFKSRRIQLEIDDDSIEIIGIPQRGDLRLIERQLAEIGISLENVSWRP